MKKVSVILPAYKPNGAIFRRTLQYLNRQDLPSTEWELLIVASGTPVEELRELSDEVSKEDIRFLYVPEPGLTRARLAGIKDARGDILIFVDDDNFLSPDYLSKALFLLDAYKQVVVAGGKSKPKFEVTPPSWIEKCYRLLALRDMGEELKISSLSGHVEEYPDYAPIGAGMILRRSVALQYAESRGDRIELPDRTAKSLTSGGDNDIVLFCLKSKGEVAYFPELILHHYIPHKRLQVSYLATLNYESSRSWVKVLSSNGICPWRKLNVVQSFARQIVSFFKTTPWLGGEYYIKWRGICGHYRGRSEI